jgi:hypothetical protein
LPPLRLVLLTYIGTLNFWRASTAVEYAGDSVLPEGGWKGFIRVQGGRFVDADCQEFPVAGANT